MCSSRRTYNMILCGTRNTSFSCVPHLRSFLNKCGTYPLYLKFLETDDLRMEYVLSASYQVQIPFFIIVGNWRRVRLREFIKGFTNTSVTSNPNERESRDRGSWPVLRAKILWAFARDISKV